MPGQLHPSAVTVESTINVTTTTTVEAPQSAPHAKLENV